MDVKEQQLRSADEHDDHQSETQTLGLRRALIVSLLFRVVGKCIQTQATDIQGHELSYEYHYIELRRKVNDRQELDRGVEN